jgi:glycerol-3-phosphate acyltransferase PlsX
LARIALDAMGGDFAPRATIAGALLALAELSGSHVVQLLGKSRIIERELDEVVSETGALIPVDRDRIVIIDAPDSISMSEKPTRVVRASSRNPMAVGLRLQKEHESDAFVSAGSTGAQMAASALLLGKLPGLKRPAIATVLPTSTHPVVFIDSGANVDCSPEELVQFAWLGVVYAECVLGRKDPVVGLLSIGEEKEKGNMVTKAAHALFAEAGFNFQGNVEGRDVPYGASDRGVLDVVVCDGFTGNIVLKFYEAIMPMIVRVLSSSSDLAQGALEKALGPLDTADYGGAPLLGVQGVSIICHGNSPPRAIKNAVKVAVRAVETRMNDHIAQRLLESSAAAPEGQTA